MRSPTETPLNDERRFTKITVRGVLASPFVALGVLLLGIGALIGGG